MLMMAIKHVRLPSSSVFVRSCQRYCGRAANDMGVIVDTFHGWFVNELLTKFAKKEYCDGGRNICPYRRLRRMQTPLFYVTRALFVSALGIAILYSFPGKGQTPNPPTQPATQATHTAFPTGD